MSFDQALPNGGHWEYNTCKLYHVSEVDRWLNSNSKDGWYIHNSFGANDNICVIMKRWVNCDEVEDLERR